MRRISKKEKLPEDVPKKQANVKGRYHKGQVGKGTRRPVQRESQEPSEGRSQKKPDHQSGVPGLGCQEERKETQFQHAREGKDPEHRGGRTSQGEEERDEARTYKKKGRLGSNPKIEPRKFSQGVRGPPGVSKVRKTKDQQEESEQRV